MEADEAFLTYVHGFAVLIRIHESYEGLKKTNEYMRRDLSSVGDSWFLRQGEEPCESNRQRWHCWLVESNRWIADCRDFWPLNMFAAVVGRVSGSRSLPALILKFSPALLQPDEVTLDPA